MNNKQLVDYLKKCDEAYFKNEQTLVSDATYDALVETLRRLDPNNEYLKTLGAVKVDSNKLGRIIPMGTLSKYHTDDELKKWLIWASELSKELLVAPKYDGFAVELIYSNHKLVSASTRGDFYVGEDVLPAMSYIEGIPSELPETAPAELVVRGEAIIPKKYHSYVKDLGYTAMRNAVPGVVRSCREDALKYVHFIAYEFIDGDNDRISQRVKYALLFNTESYYSIGSDNFLEEFEYIKEIRDEFRSESYNFPYEIDGVVLKFREIPSDEDYASPKYSIAWKYQSKLRETILRDVEFSMGVTGSFTPIGIFDTVEFQGAKLTRASLGSLNRLKEEFEGLTIGSVVQVSRRGDIIPYIEEMTLIDESGTPVEVPTVCPHCGHPLSLEGEPHCVNKSCPEKLRLQIVQYAKSVGVKGIGDRLVSSLIEAGLLKSITDIYSMEAESILCIPRQGQSSVEKWKSLQSKKLSDLELLVAYPFSDLGKRVWEAVLSRFSFSEIMNLTYEELEGAKLKGIGDSKINSIITQVKENKEELESLQNIHSKVQ